MINNNTNDLFVIFITVVITLNGIGIPLSLNIISDHLKEYSDSSIHKMILNEKTLKENIIVSVYAIIFFSVPLFIDLFNVKFYDVEVIELVNGIRVVLLILYCFLFAGFLITFFDFSKRVFEYATDTENIVFNNFKKEIDEYLS